MLNAHYNPPRFRGRLSSAYLIKLVHKKTGHFVYWDPETPWNQNVYERWTPEHGTVLNGICSDWLEQRMNSASIQAPRSPTDDDGLSEKGIVPGTNFQFTLSDSEATELLSEASPIVPNYIDCPPLPDVELFVINPNGTVHRPECYMAATGAEPVGRATAILNGKRVCKRCFKNGVITKLTGEGDA